MRYKSKRKIREPRELEKTFRVEYKSTVDNFDYWTLIHARNELEAKECFNELYSHCIDINIKEDESTKTSNAN